MRKQKTGTDRENHISNKKKTLYPEHIKNSHNSKFFLKNLIRKWTKDMNRYFTKEETEKANKQMKRRLTSLVIKKMHTETTVEHDTHS